MTRGRRRWHWAWGVPADLDDVPGLLAEDNEGSPRLRDWRDGFHASYALSHRIQGSAAECMLIAIVAVADRLRGTPARLVASVHDELLAVMSMTSRSSAGCRCRCCTTTTAAL